MLRGLLMSYVIDKDTYILDALIDIATYSKRQKKTLMIVELNCKKGNTPSRVIGNRWVIFDPPADQPVLCDENEAFNAVVDIADFSVHHNVPPALIRYFCRKEELLCKFHHGQWLLIKEQTLPKFEGHIELFAAFYEYRDVTINSLIEIGEPFISMSFVEAVERFIDEKDILLKARMINAIRRSSSSDISLSDVLNIKILQLQRMRNFGENCHFALYRLLVRLHNASKGRCRAAGLRQ